MEPLDACPATMVGVQVSGVCREGFTALGLETQGVEELLGLTPSGTSPVGLKQPRKLGVHLCLKGSKV